VLAEIRRFYEELNKFWTEIRCVVEALKKGRTDPRDFERWKDFNSSLNQTIEFWRVCYFALCTLQVPTHQNTVFRIGHRAAMHNPYATTMRFLLQFVYSPFHFGSPLD
jgi:hypothetical protein